MATISLCMIVKNEEDVLKRALKSANGIYDELIIVDTGSTDNTLTIAKTFTDKVFNFAWINDFSAARNYAASFAVCDYIMWLDADDVINDENRTKIMQIKSEMDINTDIVMLKYIVGFDDYGNSTLEYFRERIYKNNGKYLFIGEVHEAVPLHGNIVYSDAAIFHKKIKQNPPARNLNIYRQLIEKGVKLSPRQKYYYARELFYNNENKAAIDAFEDFLTEKEAYIENTIDACKMLSYSYIKDGAKNKALCALLRSFEYDIPRPDICCELGKYFIEQGSYKTAIFWYKCAIEYKHDDNTGAFINRDYSGFIPYINLCVCYYRIGDITSAEKYNSLAAEIKPYDNAVLYNIDFFNSLQKGTTQS